MSYQNGRLPDSVLAPIPSGRLHTPSQLAWNAMREHIGRHHGVWLVPTGPNSSYRTYAAQLYFYRLYQAGKGNVAAYPGTSNHGWGKAVDVLTTTMAYYIRKYGYLFGWSHAEGARVGEWWHFTYVGGYSKPAPARDPLWFMTDRERRLIREYESLKKANHDRPRRVEILQWLVGQRKRVWREAEKGSNPGWNKAHRQQRYRILSHYKM